MRTLIILSKHAKLAFVCLSLASCGGGGGDGSNQSLSTGLKIFSTAADHIGDFANDPLLVGNNAIEKADYFCNQDNNKPNSSTYKALLVDGINRDAVSHTDWVLLPNTTYYRSYGDIEIGTTISTAIFPVKFQDLTNSITVDLWNYLPGTEQWDTWSGIGDLITYATDGSRNCNNWTSGMYDQGIYAISYLKDYKAISTESHSIDCGTKLHLYCVEQQP